MSFLNSIENKSKKFETPFTHWELNEPLTEEQINEIVNAEIDNPIEHNLNYDGTRAIDGGEGKFREGIKTGGKAKKYRCFLTQENAKSFPELTKFINELASKNVYQYISELIKKDLSNSFVISPILSLWDTRLKTLDNWIQVNDGNFSPKSWRFEPKKDRKWQNEARRHRFWSILDYF